LDRAEVELHLAKERTSVKVGELTEKKDFEQALVEISRLRPFVDTFFDKVMVMVEDEVVRGVRLMMLGLLVKQFSTIADFSEIVTEGKESKESSKVEGGRTK
jgi:glycyl-tRNA synthetase beta chain